VKFNKKKLKSNEIKKNKSVCCWKSPPPHFGERYRIFVKLTKEPIQWEKGYVIPSTKPDLGIELNESVAKKYPYTGTKLHLEMVEI